MLTAFVSAAFELCECVFAYVCGGPIGFVCVMPIDFDYKTKTVKRTVIKQSSQLQLVTTSQQKTTNKTINMKFFAVCFFAVVAVAAAKPGILAAAPLAYTAPAVVGSAAYVAPYASSFNAHQVAHSAAFPAAYTAPIAAPLAAAAYTAPVAAYSAPLAAAYTSPLAYPAPLTAAYTAPIARYAAAPIAAAAYTAPIAAAPLAAAAPVLLKK
ncbi:cuticle protein 38-like [Drosophila tropicalis]|uniref:cuticle protein 38-like n=2 Tax=Drosophila tropicalis TaxID=46794 RepID=UPI0035ABB3EB